MAATKRRKQPAAKPINLRSGTRLDHRLTRRVWSNNRHVGYFDPSFHVYQFGGALDTFFMRIYDSLMLGMSEWRLCDNEADWIEYVEEPGSGNCWFTSIDLARDHGNIFDTPRGPRFGIPKRAFDIYTPSGSLVYDGARLHVPRWVEERAAVCPDCEALNYGNAMCSTCRARWPDGDPLAAD